MATALLAAIFVAGGLAMRLGAARSASTEADLLALVEERLGLVARFSGGGTLPSCLNGISAPTALCGGDAGALAPGQMRRFARASEHLAGGQQPLDPDMLRRQALWELLHQGDPAARSRAVSLLGLAMERDVSSPARRNDLVAALLVRGCADRRPADWELALELADSAAEALPEAAFNRALALNLLTLHRQARAAWSKLTVAAIGGRETPLSRGSRRLADLSARRGHAELMAARTEDDLYPLRRRAERLLGAWGARALANDEGRAAESLLLASAAAEQHARETGDRLLAETARRIAESHGNAADERALAAGHAAYDRARGDALYANCSDDLAVADRQLTAARTPFAAWAHLDRAICAYFEKRMADADRELDRAAAVVAGQPYPALAGRVQWIRGLLRMVAARFPEAEREIRSAAAALAVAREPAHVAYLDSLLAKTLDHAGDPDRAWDARWRVLRSRTRLDSARLYTAFDEAADSALAKGYRRAAAYFLGAQVRATVDRLPASGPVPSIAVFTVLDEASLLRELGRLDRARAAVASAEALWRRVPRENESRRQLAMEIATQRGALDGPLPRALAAVDEEVAFLSQGDSEHFEVLRLLLLRGRLQLAAGARAGAEADLRRATALVERDLGTIAADVKRARMLVAARPAYDELIGLLLDDGRAAEALAVLENATAHVSGGTPAMGAGAASVPLPVVPPGTLVLRFAALPSRLVTWSLDARGLRVASQAVTASNLRLVVAACRQAIASGAADATAEPGCQRAAQLLLPAAVGGLHPGDRLVVVADALTESVPFAALPWGPAGRPLVERLRLTYAPSLRSRESSQAAAPDEALLLVVNPQLSASAFPGLPPLTAAQAAAGELAPLYRRTLVLDGAEATRERVLAALDEVDVAHFDVHSELVDAEGEGASLVLASTSANQRDGLLGAAELVSRSLGRLRLAVLAGCRTGATAPSDLPFALGLPSTLMRAGVRQVVSTAWEIEDRSSAGFFLAFHRCSRAGLPADECLRRAQLGLAQSSQRSLARPLAWSGYSLHDASWNSASKSVHQGQGAREAERGSR